MYGKLLIFIFISIHRLYTMTFYHTVIVIFMLTLCIYCRQGT